MAIQWQIWTGSWVTSSRVPCCVHSSQHTSRLPLGVCSLTPLHNPRVLRWKPDCLTQPPASWGRVLTVFTFKDAAQIPVPSWSSWACQSGFSFSPWFSSVLNDYRTFQNSTVIWNFARCPVFHEIPSLWWILPSHLPCFHSLYLFPTATLLGHSFLRLNYSVIPELVFPDYPGFLLLGLDYSSCQHRPYPS